MFIALSRQNFRGCHLSIDQSKAVVTVSPDNQSERLLITVFPRARRAQKRRILGSRMSPQRTKQCCQHHRTASGITSLVVYHRSLQSTQNNGMLFAMNSPLKSGFFQKTVSTHHSISLMVPALGLLKWKTARKLTLSNMIFTKQMSKI